jgi:hypothetical protein
MVYCWRYLAGAADVRHGLLQPLRQDRLRIRTGKGRLAGQHLVEHATQRVHVGAGIQVPLANRLLRTHVVRGAQAHAGLSEPLVCLLFPSYPLTRFPACQRPRDSEVRHQRVIAAEQDVLRLDVTVDDPVTVRVGQRVGHFSGDPEGITHGQSLFSGHTAPEGLAIHERHGEPELPIGFPGIVDAEYVRVLQASAEADLAQEAIGAHGMSQLGAENLKRHRPVMPEVVGKVHSGHAATTELALDAVAIGQRRSKAIQDIGHEAQSIRCGSERQRLDRHAPVRYPQGARDDWVDYAPAYRLPLTALRSSRTLDRPSTPPSAGRGEGDRD